MTDLRYALRTLAARPGFTTIAVLSLALGIGANTAIFSLWNGVLHSVLPAVQRPNELVILTDPDQTGSWTGRWTSRTDGPRAWLTYAEFEDVRDHADSFAAVMASQSSFATWQVRFAGRGVEDINGRFVSGGFFDVLGVKPAIGRVFTSDDDRAPRPTAVISDGFWRRRFGGQPEVIGTTFTLRETAFTVIGVTPPRFIGETTSQQPDVWLPLQMQPIVEPSRDRLHDAAPDKSMWLHVFARLRPGVSMTQADAQANAIVQAGLESFYGLTPSDPRRSDFLDQQLRLHSGARGASSARQEMSQSLTALLVAVGVLLLIACANLANLLLARGAARGAEMALRLSLGASRARLVRQLTIESLVLAAAGAVAALLVASILHDALVSMLARSDSDFSVVFALDPSVLVFLTVSALVATVMFGLWPAWQMTRTDAASALKEQARSVQAGHARSSRALVSLQVAMSLPLLVGAGLLVQTVYHLQRAELGFPSDRLLLARVNLAEVTTDGRRQATLRDRLLGELQAIPGLQAVSHSQLGVFTGGNSTSTIEVEGYTPRGNNDRQSDVDAVGPRYFSVLGAPVMLGRDISEQDRAEAPKVCVINEAFANQFFAGRNPLGMRISTVGEEERTTYQVVGVARNARTQGLREAVSPRFYVAAAQRARTPASPTFLLRTVNEPTRLVAAVRQTIQRVDPTLPILSAKTLQERMMPLVAQDNTTAELAAVFGVVALLLAAIGLYGVLSYGIARRSGEIAIRMAIGAEPGRVVAMVLAETIAVVGVGLAAGGGFAYAGSRLIDSRLYGVAPQDPLTLIGATGMLLVVAFVAAYLPALRASRLDPMAALRQQ